MIFSLLSRSLALFLVSTAVATAELSLEELRRSFESALEKEKLEHGVKKLKLQDGYVGALERLKVTLGREEKLKQAKQVLAEIEVIKAGGEVEELPDSADYRLKKLRGTWERERGKDEDAYKKQVAKLAENYFTFMEQRKRALTRAGKIKEALAVEKEIGRVGELQSVVEAINSVEGDSGLKGAWGKGNLATAKNGGKPQAPNGAEYLNDGVETYTKSRGYAIGIVPCEFSVKLRKLFIVSRIRLLLWNFDSRRYRYVVEVSADGEKWSVVANHAEEWMDSGWTDIKFEPMDVRHIRVRGIGNSMNTNFPIGELEAYSPESR